MSIVSVNKRESHILLNRMDRSPTWGSNLVKGDARVEVPNGAVYGDPTPPLPGPIGSQSGMPQAHPPMDFGPNSKRSGE